MMSSPKMQSWRHRKVRSTQLGYVSVFTLESQKVRIFDCLSTSILFLYSQSIVTSFPLSITEFCSTQQLNVQAIQKSGILASGLRRRQRVQQQPFFIMALTKFSLASFPLVDLPSSSAVHGIVTEDGLFDGHISTPEEHYYIEPASRYFSSLEDDVKQPFHSVIYKASDVIHPNLDEDGEVSVLQCIHN